MLAKKQEKPNKAEKKKPKKTNIAPLVFVYFHYFFSLFFSTLFPLLFSYLVI